MRKTNERRDDMKVAIYVRSSTEAEHRETLKFQEEDCVAKCERLKADYEVFVDNFKSGSDIYTRPAFQDMLTRIDEFARTVR